MTPEPPVFVAPAFAETEALPTLVPLKYVEVVAPTSMLTMPPGEMPVTLVALIMRTARGVVVSTKSIDVCEPITWAVSQAHPLVPNMKVVRMFVDRGGVEIYSVSDDGQNGMRNLIPMHWVRFVEETMPPEVFVEELDAAEAGETDDDDDPDDEPDPDEMPELAPATS